MKEHEQSQNSVTNVVAGSVYPSDYYGVVNRTEGKPRTDADAQLARCNHMYAVEKCRKMLDGANGACAWGRPMIAFAGNKSEKIDEEAILKYRDEAGGCGCKGDCRALQYWQMQEMPWAKYSMHVLMCLQGEGRHLQEPITNSKAGGCVRCGASRVDPTACRSATS